MTASVGYEHIYLATFSTIWHTLAFLRTRPCPWETPGLESLYEVRKCRWVIPASWRLDLARCLLFQSLLILKAHLPLDLTLTPHTHPGPYLLHGQRGNVGGEKGRKKRDPRSCELHFSSTGWKDGTSSSGPYVTRETIRTCSSCIHNPHRRNRV